MSIETIAIVGAGQAGGWAAHTLRKEGFTGTIVLVGIEAHPPHERPPLSKAVLAGEALPESTHLFAADAFAKLAVDWRPLVEAIAIDRPVQQLLLSDGSIVHYDKLILCTGGRARRLNVPGSDLPGIFGLRTLEDALVLQPALQAGQTIVVVGGGWIGLEVAATARTRGAKVIVLEAASRLCERSVPAEVSEHLLQLHLSHGVQVFLEAAVKGFSLSDQGQLQVTLGDGRVLEANSVVVGVGLIPNDELARDAGLACDGGVVVDERCHTSDPHILAAGDVAVAHNAALGQRLRLESWQNAQEQGIAAAQAALGREVNYQPLPWFWSDQYNMNLQIYGVPLAKHVRVKRENPDAASFVLFFLEDGCIRAALGSNAARELRFARRLIERQTQVTAQSLADPSVSLAKL